MQTGGPVLGREGELAEVGRRLDDHRLVTVVGPGGIGKTALARAVAEVHGSTFELGAHHVDLTRVDSEESVGRALAAQLGFPSLTALLTSPGDQPTLVIVDNCEHVLDAAAEAVAALLASCAAPSVVATSRSPLDLPGESLVVLGPLQLPQDADDASASPAVQLFLQRAADAGAPLSEADLPSVAELCRALDGVPLAIELAAARARVLSPAQVLDALDDLGALDRGGRRAGDRHATLRGTIGWSYEQLAPDAQRLFERTSVLSGRFALVTAHALRPDESSTEAETLGQLEQLVDVSLVVTEVDHGRTWFRLLHPIRRFAHEQLVAQGGVQDARARFTRHMVALALEVAGPAQGGWDDVLSDLLAHSDELVAALRHALDLDDRNAAFILLAVLWGVVHQAPVEDVSDAGEAVLRRWPDVHAPGWADAAATVASCRQVAGDPVGAIELAERALPVADRAVLAACTLPRVLGQARRALGDLDGAIAAFAQGEAAAADRGLTPYRLELSVLRAAALTDQGSLDEALRIASEAQREAAAIGSHVNDLWARVAIGFVVARTDAAGARAIFEGVLVDEAEHRYPGGEVGARQGIATAQLLGGDRVGAGETLADLLELLAQRGAQGELRSVLHLAAAILLAEGRAREAADLAATAVTMPNISSFVRTTEELFPVPTDGGTVLAPAAALRLGLRLLRAQRAEAAVGAPRRTRAEASLQRAGDLWAASYDGRTVHLRATKGLHDLARLLAEPEREVHVLDLFDAGVAQASTGPALDQAARRQLEDRIRSLQLELDDADAANDIVRSERAATELDAVVEHLAAALGLGGRDRTAGSTAERARQAVTRRLRATIRRVGEEHDSLGRHLDASVRTGSFCVYRPEQPTVWDVSFGGAPGA